MNQEIKPEVNNRAIIAQNIAGLVGIGISAIPAYFAIEHSSDKEIIQGSVGFVGTSVLLIATLLIANHKD